MTTAIRGQRIDTVFVLIVFCVFAVSVLMVLMLGANTYGHITEMSREGQAERTVVSYIWTKVRNGDEEGSVSVGEFHGLPALRIDEEYGGIRYRTVIYHYGGWVYELFSEEGLDFFPEDGTRIIAAADLVFAELGYGLIRASSGTRALLISPRSKAREAGFGSGEEASPE